MKNQKVFKSVMAALFAALTCVATMVMQISTPTHGYVNLGDCFVLLSCWLLGPVYGFFAAAIGSTLADFLAGYMVYVPATFVIKGLMAVVGYFVFKAFTKHQLVGRIIGALLAEVIMVGGYFLFESILYSSFITAATGVVANLFQALVGIVSSCVLFELIKRTGIDKEIFRTKL